MIRFYFNLFLCLLIVSLSWWYVYEILYNEQLNEYRIYRLDDVFQDLVASVFFLIIVFLLIKPSIKIADNIALLPASENDPAHLRLKLVNYSLFKAYDLHINIYEMKRVSVSGPDIRSDLLGCYEGYKQGTPYLQSSIIALFEETKRNAAQMRIKRLVSEDKFREVLNNSESYIEVHVSIRHGLSGLQGNFVKKFHNLSSIKSGVYSHGFDYRIKV